MTDLMSRPAYEYAAPGDDHRTPPPPAKGTNWPRRIVGGAAVLLLVAGGGTAGGLLAERYVTGDPATAAGTLAGSSATATATATVAEGDDLAAVVAKVQPSVVTVLVDGDGGSSLGSGVVLSADGLILTNNHVIASDGTVSVRLSTGRTVPARVVAADSGHDLALVQATGLTGLTPVTFAADDSVAVGDTVLAFGAPLGLENTVTSGIVSATDRSIAAGEESAGQESAGQESAGRGSTAGSGSGSEKLTGLLQTDAAINPGNSGGALVDLSGHVVGINVAIATAGGSDSGSIGVGFAIPAGTATAVVRTLREQIG